MLESGGHGFEAGIVEVQAIEHRGGKAFLLAGEDVLLVFGKDFGGSVAKSLRHRAEDGVFLFRRKLGEGVSGGARLPAHFVDLLCDWIGHGEIRFWGGIW